MMKKSEIGGRLNQNEEFNSKYPGGFKANDKRLIGTTA